MKAKAMPTVSAPVAAVRSPGGVRPDDPRQGTPARHVHQDGSGPVAGLVHRGGALRKEASVAIAGIAHAIAARDDAARGDFDRGWRGAVGVATGLVGLPG